jgi:hypothetical protein
MRRAGRGRRRRTAIAILLSLASTPACARRQPASSPRAVATTLPAAAPAAATAPAAPDPRVVELVDLIVDIELNRNCFGTMKSAPSPGAQPTTQP